jgi:tetratricopeptide (TPR) repeat protein
MTVDSQLARAEVHYRTGDLDRAAAICVDMLRVDPADVGALQLVEDVAFARGEFAQAIGLMRAGTLANPMDATLAYKLGCLLEAEGDLSGAVTAYSTAIRLNPRFAKAQNNLGTTLQRMGHIAEALQCFDHALALDPGLWQAHYNIGNVHKLQGRVRDAIAPFQRAMRMRRARGVVPQAPVDPQFVATSRSKLAHDIEQMNYLIERGVLAAEHKPAVAALESALSTLGPKFEGTSAIDFPPALQGAAATLYNRLLNFYDAPAIDGPAVNPDLDRLRIEADYFHHAPGITYVDDFLTPEALTRLRRFALESTIWFDFLYEGGYVGASMEEGFICPLLAQIADELPRVLPGIFGDHALTHLWGYKYDSQRDGIGEHADFAAVNVNFWLTPDSANLDPESGGLVVWDKEAPLDWDFDAFNREPGRIQRFLDESGARAVTVPYRQNRMVLFNSDLFHKTDSYHFRTGYENRRINVTYLYGYRQARDDPMAT